MRYVLTIISCLVALAGLFAQQAPAGGLWTDKDALSVRYAEGEPVPQLPRSFRLLALDLDGMKSLLQQAPERSAVRLSDSPALLEVPMPDGTMKAFRIRQAPVMHPDLARKFPQINSYEGQSADKPDQRIFFDFSPTGFHAIILTAGENPVFLTPISKEDTEHYLCYYDKDYDHSLESIECQAEGHSLSIGNLGLNRQMLASDCQLRTYRLAVAADAEFTAASATVADPTGVNNAMASINTLVTTVNGIYQTELAIQLQLVANNNLLIFTNATTDGYTDGNQNTMASENQGIVDGIIGSGNYDVSHALGTSGSPTSSSGVSLGIGTVCNNGSKAQGATVVSNVSLPGGIATLIMHEWGHQFGADHTFNENTQPICSNAGQLNAATAFEPGSGSTIMSYGGTCGTSNVQGFRDRYFHAISLQQIGNYVTTGGGSCVTPTPIANNQPSVNAGADFTVPVSTPFMLTATGSDPDGDALTFCWEQMDNQIISHPPSSTATGGPVFRTFLPTPSPTRFFPNLPAIVSGTATPWEVLPSVTRNMNFRVTVRDNIATNGCTNEDNMAVSFDNSAGPFTVSSPASGACLYAGELATVSWNVAGTDLAPVNCANVDILLSIDGGLSFPITLVSGTANDGTEQVLMPELNTPQARVMVKGSGNIFFNLNPGSFTLDCTPELIVTDNPASGTYKARDKIETSGPVTVSGTARFFAGDEIVLNPGFWAQAGSDFLARIQPCTPCVTPAMMEVSQTAGPQTPKVVFVPYSEAEDALLEGSAGALLHASLFPNPFSGQFTLELNLEAPGSLKAQLFSLAGRPVSGIYEMDGLEAGAHQVSIDGSRLPAGVYICKAWANGLLVQLKAVKLSR
ncbi:MAG: T9SS type A sorting domain-containing protein [Phaeodactylibacter sp.]|nr:T9SS type A sorting domain-containing protein [Phaeodactylibacter sp.]MCB9274829.1 T9SS type A sorting domain-containing protein [Lewinellaceae bacterium]